jgi:hypothetical protein
MLKRIRNTETYVISSDPDIFRDSIENRLMKCLKEHRTPNTENMSFRVIPIFFRDSIENRLIEMLKIIKEQRITKTNVISSDPDIFSGWYREQV